MAIIRGDNSSNTISATGPNDTIFGLSGFDVLSSTFEQADLRGGWGQDSLSVDYSYLIDWSVIDLNTYSLLPFPLMRWALLEIKAMTRCRLRQLLAPIHRRPCGSTWIPFS
ncbi:MAG: hypothetical protein H6897_14400 [Rhodobacteraceae bacterium]|nr:hypothetical protein [Paracoccaceae bacterium]